MALNQPDPSFMKHRMKEAQDNFKTYQKDFGAILCGLIEDMNYDDTMDTIEDLQETYSEKKQRSQNWQESAQEIWLLLPPQDQEYWRKYHQPPKNILNNSPQALFAKSYNYDEIEAGVIFSKLPMEEKNIWYQRSEEMLKNAYNIYLEGRDYDSSDQEERDNLLREWHNKMNE